MAGLGAKAAFLSVPNQVMANGTEAYLIVNGKPVTGSGNTSLPVSNGAVEVLYEIGMENPSVLASVLTVAGTLLDHSGSPLDFPAQAAFAGHLSPVDNVGTASPTAPEPRFTP